jgi:NTP pyrophosphatase (non-canonical NTP hydrolase)
MRWSDFNWNFEIGGKHTMKKQIDVLSPEFDRRMGLQQKEFDAVKQLAKDWDRLSMTPPVDDDYSEVRHAYESGLSALIDALRANGRLAERDFMSRLHEANVSRGKRWHPSGLVSWSLSDWFTAMAGEVGELGEVMTQAGAYLMALEGFTALAAKSGTLGNVVKKLNRARDGLKGNKESELTLRQQLSSEAADILIYLELFCQVANIDLTEATRDKFNEVSERNGFPERL